MTPYRLACILYLAVILALPTAYVAAQTKGKSTVRRAQPPKFDKADPFFEDAFKTALVGERPADLGKAAPMIAKSTGGGNTPAAAAGGGGDSASGWGAIISAAALEAEIKLQKQLVEKSVTTPSDFAGNGYKLARRDFSIAAMVFAIIGEYDGEVRWKKDAPGIRDNFARTAGNAKVGTTGVYNEAKLRKQDLEDLIGGQAVTVKEAELKAKWDTICSRSPLMMRLDMSLDPKIKAWTSSKGEFNSNLEALQNEAEIFAAIGSVLTKEGMEDGDDTEYKAFSDLLLKGSVDLVRACKDKDADAAGKAASVIATSCDKCHEQFR